jgi:hypothetical protein
MSAVTPDPTLPRRGKRWRGIGYYLGFGESSVDLASYYMLRLYRINLELRLRNIDISCLHSEHQKKNFETVAELLRAPIPTRVSAPGDEWDEMYKAESLISLLLGGRELREEISTRLQELATHDLGRADELRRAYEQLVKPSGDSPPEADDAVLRSLLLRVMEALHWSEKRKYLARPIRKEATKNTFYGVLIAFSLLLAPYLVLNLGSIDDLARWWSLFPLYTALVAGLCGAFFSRAMAVKQRWSEMSLDEVFLHREVSFMILRAGIGVCGALIVYLFLMLEPVAGAMFPVTEKMAINFADVTLTENIRMSYLKPSKDLALLMFWCFLAGFSEALVPNILANTESQLTQAGRGPQKSAS